MTFEWAKWIKLALFFLTSILTNFFKTSREIGFFSREDQIGFILLQKRAKRQYTRELVQDSIQHIQLIKI